MSQNNDLYDLLKNPETNNYFMTLPEYIRSSIISRSYNVKTVEELRRYADNLLAGDK